MPEQDSENHNIPASPLVGDLLGFAKGSEKIIDAIQKACGAIYRPYGIRREADAEAYKINTIENAKLNAKSRGIIDSARAKSEAKLIDFNAKLSIDERAELREQHKKLRKQENLDACIQEALSNSSDTDIASDPIDPDWMDKWIEHAERANSELMQTLWGKILAGETRKAGAFSQKSLSTLSGISQAEAELFQIACNLASNYYGNKIIITGSHKRSFWAQIFTNPEKEISLNEFGLSLSDIMSLRNVGLIFDDKFSIGDFHKGITAALSYHGTEINFVAKRGKPSLYGYKFTQVGSELSTLTTSVSNPAFEQAMSKALTRGFRIVND
ncbi:TIGR03899 family protein [Paraburkholderia sp. MMS20-SJTN17]|uniref:TIGR03899 family protein n=1 Tax=Paraburkholderia translucens TaxID=2886945 RepID=A0ABS8KHN8_9BURK|nr:TIGR03899 family protein [Paraburkholderia sp. MMS20-SJTN17]MCC8403917.1 TIGR03899 family protein [Paraburkholderia sp. MMS20-SJTN17]